MGTMPRLVERGKKDRRIGEPRGLSLEEIRALELDPRVELIRQLIPLGLAEVGRLLDEEVEEPGGAASRPEGRNRRLLPARVQPGVGTAGRPATSGERASGAGLGW